MKVQNGSIKFWEGTPKWQFWGIFWRVMIVGFGVRVALLLIGIPGIFALIISYAIAIQLVQHYNYKEAN